MKPLPGQVVCAKCNNNYTPAWSDHTIGSADYARVNNVEIAQVKATVCQVCGAPAASLRLTYKHPGDPDNAGDVEHPDWQIIPQPGKDDAVEIVVKIILELRVTLYRNEHGGEDMPEGDKRETESLIRRGVMRMWEAASSTGASTAANTTAALTNVIQGLLGS